MGWKEVKAVFDHSTYTRAAFAIDLAIAETVNEKNDFKLWGDAANHKSIAKKSRIERRQTVTEKITLMLQDGRLILLEDNHSKGVPSVYQWVNPADLARSPDKVEGSTASDLARSPDKVTLNLARSPDTPCPLSVQDLVRSACNNKERVTEVEQEREGTKADPPPPDETYSPDGEEDLPAEELEVWGAGEAALEAWKSEIHVTPKQEAQLVALQPVIQKTMDDGCSVEQVRLMLENCEYTTGYSLDSFKTARNIVLRQTAAGGQQHALIRFAETFDAENHLDDEERERIEQYLVRSVRGSRVPSAGDLNRMAFQCFELEAPEFDVVLAGAQSYADWKARVTLILRSYESVLDRSGTGWCGYHAEGCFGALQEDLTSHELWVDEDVLEQRWKECLQAPLLHPTAKRYCDYLIRKFLAGPYYGEHMAGKAMGYHWHEDVLGRESFLRRAYDEMKTKDDLKLMTTPGAFRWMRTLQQQGWHEDVRTLAEIFAENPQMKELAAPMQEVLQQEQEDDDQDDVPEDPF